MANRLRLVATIRYHIALVISLSIPASVLENWALSAMAAVMFLCCMMVSLARVHYKRR